MVEPDLARDAQEGGEISRGALPFREGLERVAGLKRDNGLERRGEQRLFEEVAESGEQGEQPHLFAKFDRPRDAAGPEGEADAAICRR